MYMGTCCASCLPTKVLEYAPNAQNGSVTVKIIEYPVEGGSILNLRMELKPEFAKEMLPLYIKVLMQLRVMKHTISDYNFTLVIDGKDIELSRCDICGIPAVFTVSYYPKDSRIRQVETMKLTPEEIEEAGLPRFVDVEK